LNNYFKNNVVRIVCFCGKLLLANIIVILTVSFFLPLFYTPNSPLPTLYGRPFPHRKANINVCRTFYEGYIDGMLDSNGFNNLYCIENNIPPTPGQTQRNLSLLFGDSHMEAYHVPMDKNCCYLINKGVEKVDRNFLLYNIAFNALKLSDIVEQYNEAIDFFHPRQFALIEIKNFPDPSEVREITLSQKGGLARFDTFGSRLEENKYIRFVLERTVFLRAVLYNIQMGMWGKKNIEGTSKQEEWNEENVVYLRELLKKFSEPSRSQGIQPIIFYHSRFTLHADGSAMLNENPKIVELYRIECEKQGIAFLYLGDRFIQEYEENNVLPYGFWNMLPNAGHLNQDGHRMVAEELCKVIEQLEETRKKDVSE